jgi:Trypsin
LSQSVPWPSWAARSAILHPLYDGVPGDGHDLALIRLPAGALAGVPRVQVGSPWDPGAYAAGLGSTIMGYGQTGGSVTEDGAFRVAGTALRSGAAMAGTFAWKDALMIGAGSSGQTTCFGDSGGPLVERRAGRVVQVGVTSFGTQSCNQAAAFAELRGPQLAWIAINVPSIVDSWGTCTGPSGGAGVSEATYVAANTTGPQADGPYYGRSGAGRRQ